MPLHLHPFSRRVDVALNRLGARTVSGLRARTAKELLAQPGFGPAALEEVRRFLAERDFKLRGDEA